MKKILFILIVVFTIQVQSQVNVAGVNLSSNKSQLFTITTKKGNTYTTKKYKQKLREIRFKTEEGEKKIIALSQLDRIVATGKKERHNYTKRYIKYSKSRSDLMTEMISGKVSLYLRTKITIGGANSMGMPNSSTSNSFYVKKEGQSVAKYIKGDNIAYGRFKINAIKFFGDCESLVNKIKNKDYKRKHLVKMVHYYNENCN